MKTKKVDVPVKPPSNGWWFNGGRMFYFKSNKDAENDDITEIKFPKWIINKLENDFKRGIEHERERIKKQLGV